MRRLLAPFVLLCLSVPAFAQNPPRQVVPPLPGQAGGVGDTTSVIFNLGYVKTGGNTDVQTITASEKIEHATGSWKFLQQAGAVNGKTDGIESAARYDARLRADYAWTEHFGVYGLADWRRDPFAGISSQFEEGVGGVLHVLQPQPHELDLEAGVGILQRRFTTEIEDNFTNARAGLHYAYHFSDKSHFDADASYLANLEDTGDGDLHSLFQLIAPLTGGISLRVAYDLYYRTEPQAGFDKLDTTFSTGVQVVL